jgi:hypothetical protein
VLLAAPHTPGLEMYAVNDLSSCKRWSWQMHRGRMSTGGASLLNLVLSGVLIWMYIFAIIQSSIMPPPATDASR